METNENKPIEIIMKDEISIIMRQTTYTKEEAETLFNELGTVEKCIAHYLEIKPKEGPSISTNQKIFKSIRDFF
jgi:ABC-type Zn uptake system ZnuABC Zn-binding protein ZnuA